MKILESFSLQLSANMMVVTQWEYTLMLENGAPTGVFCIGFDITEFVAVKTAIQSMNRDLEVKNELLEAIAFEQSHIVRAPLANIIGLTSILKNLNLGVNASAVIKMLEESSNKLDDVIKNIVIKTSFDKMCSIIN